MSFKNPNAYETWNFIFRKKVKISASDPATPVGPPPVPQPFFVPNSKKKYYLVGAYLVPTRLLPAKGAADFSPKASIQIQQQIPPVFPATAPTYNTVIASQNLAVADVAKELTITSKVFIDHTTPLVYNFTAAGPITGTTPKAQEYDFILVLHKIGD
jgi:hypothetical protein